MNNNNTASRLAFAIVLAICLSAGAPAAATDSQRQARVLVVLGVVEQQNHIYFYNAERRSIKIGRAFGAPWHGRSMTAMQLTRVTHLNQQFTSVISGFNRYPALESAITQAFAERAPLVQITTTPDANRYLSGTLNISLTEMPKAENYDFVLVLNEDFVGLAANDELDVINGLMTPAYDVSYKLHDVVSGEIVARGKASANGYLRQPVEKATSDPALFGYLWPYLCTLNAVEVVDQLLRDDQLHAMAVRAGRGDELPPVAAKLADFERRLRWNLKSASGWRERSATPYSHVMEPRIELRNSMRMTFDVDYLIPELGLGVKTVDQFLPIYDRKRLRDAPKAKALEPFSDIAAPGYRVFRYEGQAGEINLLLLRATDDALMQIVTISIADDFDKVYPKIRGKLEQMLAGSQVKLAAG